MTHAGIARLMEDVLGRDGAAALSRAVERAPELAGSLAPRTALAWSRLAVSRGYSGAAPGRSEASLLVKSDEWTAHVGETQASGKGEASLAAALLVMCDAAGQPGLAAGQPLLRLGKSLDALAAAVWDRRHNTVKDLRDRARSMAKANRGGGGGGGGGGVEAPGPAHKPEAPKAPEPPVPTQKQPGAKATSPAAPKPPKSPGLPGAKAPKQGAFMRSELEAPCTACGRAQLTGDGLTLCACFEAMAKSVKTVKSSGDSLILSFGNTWAPEDFVTFCEGVRRG